ncbi:hypothetical protein ACFOQM_01665 [Paenibacillus sp. GCM10012307]|uniref:YtzI protein n=1 Tax=Paenibacillus roseus TaxID=2798579 RepID=A0A934MTF9_9BACL|nr:hypothetical protein [Paenibacillus roseus]MBJ6360027.1 hypothetical protein [Paenibacillus roseus]
MTQAALFFSIIILVVVILSVAIVRFVKASNNYRSVENSYEDKNAGFDYLKYEGDDRE